MSLLVPIALFGWIPAVVAMFALAPARRAVLIALVGGWLFLPMASYPISGLPDYDKTMAACLAVLLGTTLFDPDRLTRFQPSWLDLPMLAWCLTPFMSSMASGLGPYDGLSSVLSQVVAWGIPYFVGRIYFRDLVGLQALAVAILIGGLVYVPLCLFEIRMSPQLHTMIYGFHQHSFAQSKRWGGWRPVVFMQHGLAVGMWMSVASLVALWLWRTGAWRSIRVWGGRTAFVVLLVTTMLCKSAGALVLMLVGYSSLYSLRRFGAKVALLAAAAFSPIYICGRASGLWSGDLLVSIAEAVSSDRADSLRSRLNNEDIIIANAKKSLLFGHGYRGWLVSNAGDPTAEEVYQAVPDGLWVIALGRNGIVGLASLYLALLLPTVVLVLRSRPAGLAAPPVAGAMVLAVTAVLFAIDCLFNAMLNPILVAAVGGITALVEPQNAALNSGLRVAVRSRRGTYAHSS